MYEFLSGRNGRSEGLDARQSVLGVMWNDHLVGL